ncbi:Beta-1,3-glucan-binding protein [Orchesella cincta]|uniref:Beta-1,3-glucan-binding protein n=1 Tax=Orchesella cincta TaxID=48709 RepID=A0A1D2M728_ORCCI|nr:Beta-1,3-glucan-binding protein [Orchesella cincta]
MSQLVNEMKENLGHLINYYNFLSWQSLWKVEELRPSLVSTKIIQLDQVNANRNEMDEMLLKEIFREAAQSEMWSVTTVNGKRVKAGTLAFAEEFTTMLDGNSSFWKFINGTGANYFDTHSKNVANTFVRDGILHLKPSYVGNWNSRVTSRPIMTPMLVSKNAFQFKYGKLQIRAKMVRGDWIDPVISLLPAEKFYGEGLRSGQIHLVDTKGNRNLFNEKGINVGSEQTCPDIRFGTEDNRKVEYYCLNTAENQGIDRDFHLYELQWTPDSITLKIDDEGVFSTPFPRSSTNFGRVEGIYQTLGRLRAQKIPILPLSIKSFISRSGSRLEASRVFSVMIISLQSFWEAGEHWKPTWEGDRSSLQIDFIRLHSLEQLTEKIDDGELSAELATSTTESGFTFGTDVDSSSTTGNPSVLSSFEPDDHNYNEQDFDDYLNL